MSSPIQRVEPKISFAPICKLSIGMPSELPLILSSQMIVALLLNATADKQNITNEVKIFKGFSLSITVI
jgi:hypothetical protein